MKKLTFIALGLFVFAGLSAQSLDRQVIATAGGYFDNGEISISWKLGEVITETVSTPDRQFILTQGFQQPDMFQKTASVVEVAPESHHFDLNLYPNPTVDNVYLNISTDEAKAVSLELVDMMGRNLYQDKLELMDNEVTNYSLDMASLPAGMYFIRLNDISSNQSVIKTYKVQKVD